MLYTTQPLRWKNALSVMWRIISFITILNSNLIWPDFCGALQSRTFCSIFDHYIFYKNHNYCRWLNFRGAPIFVVFVEGPIHEFEYPWISDFQYELWRKILWPWILNLTNVSFSFNPRKLVPTKTSILRVLQKQYRSPTVPNKFKSATIISLHF